MNSIRHYLTSRHSGYGRGVSLLTVLPDVFIPLRRIPLMREFCLDMHNSRKGVERMRRIGIGIPWEIHRQQDISSHNLEYTDADRIPRDSIMLFSGGLDSFCQWMLLGQPRAVYFAIGHQAQNQEVRSIGRILGKFGGNIEIVDMLKMGNYEFLNGYIPFRNLFFIMLASLMSPNVVISQIAEWAPDKNSRFYRRTESLLRLAGKGAFQGIDIRPKIYSPFSSFTKSQLVQRYLNRWSVDDLRLTVSCYSGKIIPCGKCTACVSRYIAMTNNGVIEEYASEPNVDLLWKKLTIADFRVSQIPMYMKRWREKREFDANILRVKSLRES